MTRSLRVLLGLAAAVAGCLAAASPSTAAPTGAAVHATGVVVSPDPSRDLYVGTGGIVVPENRWRGGDRTEAAGCPGCQWRVSLLCTKAEFAQGGCPSIHVGCPIGTVAVRIWLLRPGQDWAVVGQACQGGSPPVTVDDVGSAVRGRAEAALPPLRAGVEPRGGALVGLPAVFRTGQPAAGIQGADLSVLGLDVRLDARVRWQWTYGDGTAQWTSAPGGPWPDLSVSHVYRRATTAVAQVQAVWRGEYVVEGLGPFVVPGAPLTQVQDVAVVVREARARLVG